MRYTNNVYTECSHNRSAAFDISANLKERNRIMRKYGKRRVLALLLSLTMLFLALPSPILAQTVEVEGKKGTDFSENTYISGQLQVLFDKLVYGQTPYFTVEGSSSCGNVACTSCGLVDVSKKHPALKDLGITFDTTAYGSGAFARYAFALIFGTKLSAINYFGNTIATIPLQSVGRVSTERSEGKPAVGVSGAYQLMSIENLKGILQKGTPGDLIQAHSSSGGNHSMILLASTDTGVTVLHSVDYNVEGVEKNKVIISEMTYEELMTSWDQIITLFRADAETYAETWAKGETVHLTCRYTDESGNNCSVCGKEVSPLPTVSVAGAGVYMATVDTSAHVGYYRSTTKQRTIAAGGWVTASGSVVNATGKTFYLLTDGSYVPAEDFGSGAGTAPTINLTVYPVGNLPYGTSYNLRGTVSMSGGLSYVSGYMLKPDGTIDHHVTQSTTSSSLDIYYSQINSKMKFGSLAQGDYVMMIVACSASGVASAKLYPFSITKQTMTTPSAPAAPTVASKTANSVTLKATSGYQYSKDGSTWQNSNVFTGLSPATTYTFYQRIAATSTSNPSPASAGLKVTTDKLDTAAPAAPTLSSKTATSVTLVAISGYEYGISGGSWQSSPTFTNLSPGTTYYFFQRVAATSSGNVSEASPSLEVTTNKTNTAAPAAPTVASKTANSVTLAEKSGYQYSKDGIAWQSSPTFGGLQPATTYTFYQRIAETQTAYASPSSASLKVTTYKASVSAPSAPTLASKTDVSVTLTAKNGYQYSKDGKNWQNGATFTGLLPATSYTFYQRIAETDIAYASPSSQALTVITNKSAVSAPSAPTLSGISGLKVTLNGVKGGEFSMDGGKTWQSSAVFTVAAYGKYTFVCRIAETATTYASPASKTLTVEVNPKTVTSKTLRIDEEKDIVAGVAVGQTVAELLAQIEESAFVTVKTADGKEASSSQLLHTGMILLLPEGEQYLLAVTGDTDGDGAIGIFDLTAVKRQIVNGTGLSDVACIAADADESGTVDLFDYVAIRKYILSGTLF